MKAKPVSYIVEVARSIEQDATEEVGFTPPIDFLITGGTILKALHGKDEDNFYLEYASGLSGEGAEVSDYEDRVERALREGLKGCVTGSENFSI